MQAEYQAPLSLLELTGDDVQTFLQNQLTQDVRNLEIGQWVFSGHCDAKGKLWSLLRVWRTDEAYYLLTSPEAAQASLTQMQKFSVFSKVAIKNLTPSTGFRFYPETAFVHGHVAMKQQGTAGPVFQLGLGQASLMLSIGHKDSESHVALNETPWLRYEIEHGVAQLTAATIGEYVPQMLGVDSLGGINFKKGCYIGQETVARMHYLGQNKRALRRVVGSSAKVPSPGDTLEQKLGDNWRRAGAVINAVRYDNNEVAILAVVPADLGEDVAIRIKGDEQSQMTLRPKFDNQENFQ